MTSRSVPLSRATRNDVARAAEASSAASLAGSSATPMSSVSGSISSDSSGPVMGQAEDGKSVASGPISMPLFPCTNEAKVLRAHERCAAVWRRHAPQSNHPNMQGRGDFGWRMSLTRDLLKAAGLETTRWHEYDSRLSTFHLYLSSGLQPMQLVGSPLTNPEFLRGKERIQHLVRQQPECLVVPVGPRGRHFIPVDQEWLARCDEKMHGFRQPLAAILSHRISQLMFSDGIGLINGCRDVPQPSGRYHNAADSIARWNSSLGFCATCRSHIYFAEKEEWTDAEWLAVPENVPPFAGDKATIARTWPTYIHLANNVAEKIMLCTRCNSRTNFNPRQKAEHAMRPLGK